jgi:hypothetical protein
LRSEDNATIWVKKERIYMEAELGRESEERERLNYLVLAK